MLHPALRDVSEAVTLKENLIVAYEGNRTVVRRVEHYNLESIVLLRTACVLVVVRSFTGFRRPSLRI